MSISGVCPVLNEQRFLRANIHCCLDFADEIIYCDTGSSDWSYYLLQEYAAKDKRIKVLRYNQGRPAYWWKESEIRNLLVEQAKCDWICGLDADELLGEEFFAARHDLERSARPFIRFRQLAFYYVPWLIRARDYRSLDGWRANGLANQSHRLKAIGNGQVPLQAAVAYSILREAFNAIQNRK